MKSLKKLVFAVMVEIYCVVVLFCLKKQLYGADMEFVADLFILAFIVINVVIVIAMIVFIGRNFIKEHKNGIIVILMIMIIAIGIGIIVYMAMTPMNSCLMRRLEELENFYLQRMHQ